ncbi:MAG: hypothetical protein A2428_05085 [Bdellovibrionales bacterium RIFOXYC1_FULL_54_43]|nr:MAG: hypothetical protein A2428_05085 [Bdellovibrionales bacterium RIFOXYC1_FULL_54_43]OFZ83987.1 MAG: hypothetical protein A2603_10585 [Bdellovibrionales bacterium RIFOXYD1_FULL_55_31]
MKVSLIAAVAKNQVIGKEGTLPWHLPDDLKRFKRITMGHPIIMGRKTFESLGRALPGRLNIIISRTPEFHAPEGTVVARSLDEALKAAADAEEVFVIGGAQIYDLALSRADRLYLTMIDQEIAGDAFFPEWSFSEFREIFREEHTHPVPYTFLIYQRAV